MTDLSDRLFSVSNSYATAQTDAILWSPDSTVKFCITDIIISTTAANVITIEEDISPDKLLFKFDLAANGGAVINLTTPIRATADGTDLLLTSSATTNLYITVVGYEEE
jgi:hypothetical protein